jgi:hypothetical protein
MALALMAALAVGFGAAGGAGGGRPQVVRHGGGPAELAHGTLSTNWAGYAAQGGPFTSVSASWVQPAGRCGAFESSWSSFWVGLDGSGSNSVEQAGSEVDCDSGRPIYYGWYEVYPYAPVNYPEAAQAGDVFTSSVTGDQTGNFTISLVDQTQGWSHTERFTYAGAPLSSAEVVAEAPLSDAGVVPLTNFGSVRFAGARVNGQPIGYFNTVPISMATPDYMKAEPSGLAGGTDFSVTWSHW